MSLSATQDLGNVYFYPQYGSNSLRYCAFRGYMRQ